MCGSFGQVEECAITTFTDAIIVHIDDTIKFDLTINIGDTVDSKFINICSIGCAYNAAAAIGGSYS